MSLPLRSSLASLPLRSRTHPSLCLRFSSDLKPCAADACESITTENACHKGRYLLIPRASLDPLTRSCIYSSLPSSTLTSLLFHSAMLACRTSIHPDYFVAGASMYLAVAIEAFSSGFSSIIKACAIAAFLL